MTKVKEEKKKKATDNDVDHLCHSCQTLMLMLLSFFLFHTDTDSVTRLGDF